MKITLIIASISERNFWRVGRIRFRSLEGTDMTKAGKKLIAAAEEALAIARGEAEPASVHVYDPETGETYKLPPGVHWLTEESRVILDKARLRGERIAARHLKREP